MVDQNAKADAGKLKLVLVPSQIIRDIAEVRMYGTEKYHEPDNWKKVEIERYINALYRHFLAFMMIRQVWTMKAAYHIISIWHATWHSFAK